MKISIVISVEVQAEEITRVPTTEALLRVMGNLFEFADIGLEMTAWEARVVTRDASDSPVYREDACT